MKQRQFLEVIDEAEAHRRFDAACAHLVPAVEEVPLDRALGRVLAADVFASVDVPAFDRANVDGFAVRAADTFGAEELHPVRLQVAPLSLAAGQAPPANFEVAPGWAVPIATGGVLPRGADAVVMVEDTRPEGTGILLLPLGEEKSLSFNPLDPPSGLTLNQREAYLRDIVSVICTTYLPGHHLLSHGHRDP